MKINTAVTINGHLVELVGEMGNLSLYRLDDEYGSDLFLANVNGTVIGDIRVVSEDIEDIRIKELEE